MPSGGVLAQSQEPWNPRAAVPLSSPARKREPDDFGPRVAIAWDAAVSLASTMPAGKLTTGHPPRGLVSRVPYFGQPHTPCVAYLNAAAQRRHASGD